MAYEGHELTKEYNEDRPDLLELVEQLITNRNSYSQALKAQQQALSCVIAKGLTLLSDYQILIHYKDSPETDPHYQVKQSAYHATVKLQELYQQTLVLQSKLMEAPKQRSMLTPSKYIIINDVRYQGKEIQVIGDGWCTLRAIGIADGQFEDAIESIIKHLDRPNIINHIRNAIYNNYQASLLPQPEKFALTSECDKQGDNICNIIQVLYQQCQANDLVQSQTAYIELMAYCEQKDVQIAYLKALLSTKYTDSNIASAYLSINNKQLAILVDYHLPGGRLVNLTSDNIDILQQNVVCVIYYPSTNQTTAHYNAYQNLQPVDTPMTEVNITTTPQKNKRKKGQGKQKAALVVKPEDLALVIQHVQNQDLKHLKEALDKLAEVDTNYAGKLLDTLDETGKAAIHYAAATGNSDIIKYIKSQNASYANTDWKILPLHVAAQNGHAHVLEHLYNKRSTPDHTISDNGYTALHIAVENNDEKSIKQLLELGADPLMKTKSGSTVLELAKSEKIKNFFNALLPGTKLLQEATCIPPTFSKMEAKSYDKIHAYMAWRRYGQKWQIFKQTLKTCFEYQEDPYVSQCIKMQCQKITRNVGNWKANEQFLYYLCASGYEDIIDFLLDYGVDFTYSTRGGDSSNPVLWPAIYLGLYCAIEFCQPRVVEVLLKNSERATKYLFDLKRMPEETIEQKTQIVTPLMFAEKKMRECADRNEQQQYQKILQLLRDKLNAKQPKSTQQLMIIKSANVKPTQTLQSEVKQTDLFKPAYEPNSEAIHIKIEEGKAQSLQVQVEVKDTATSLAQQPEAPQFTLEQQELAEKNRRHIGIWGEAALFFHLKNEYLTNFVYLKEDHSIIANGFVLKSSANKHEKDLQEVKVKWSNKQAWEVWQQDKEKTFIDSGAKPYDFIVIETTAAGTVQKRYIELKSTDSETKSLVKMTGREVEFMRTHRANYTFFRCYHAGSQQPRYVKYDNLADVLFKQDSPVTEIKFYLK